MTVAAKDASRSDSWAPAAVDGAFCHTESDPSVGRSVQGQRRAVGEHFEATHDDWDRYYDAREATGDVFRTRLRLAMELCRRHVRQKGRALDLGCGAGPASIELAEAGHDVTGVDLSHAMVGRAGQAAEKRDLSERCRFVAGDFLTLHLDPGSFDVIVALGFIEYFDAPMPVLDRIQNLLTSTGIAVVQITNRFALKHILRGKAGPAIERTWSGLDARQYGAAEFARIARRAGLRTIDYRGHGFTPIKIAGRFVPGYRGAAWIAGNMDRWASRRAFRGLGRVGTSIVNVLTKRR